MLGINRMEGLNCPALQRGGYQGSRDWFVQVANYFGLKPQNDFPPNSCKAGILNDKERNAVGLLPLLPSTREESSHWHRRVGTCRLLPRYARRNDTGALPGGKKAGQRARRLGSRTRCPVPSKPAARCHCERRPLQAEWSNLLAGYWILDARCLFLVTGSGLSFSSSFVL